MQPNKRFTITLYQAWLCFVLVTHTITHTLAFCRHGAVCSHMTGVLCFFCSFFFSCWRLIEILHWRIHHLYYKRKKNIAYQHLFSPPDSGVSWPLSSVHLILFHLRHLQGHKVICLHVPDTHPALLLKVVEASYLHVAPQGFLFFFLLYCLAFLFSLFMGHIYIYTGCLSVNPFFIVSLDMFEIRRLQAAY